jgi:lipopolysaccharide cholinephosphotransferase
MELTEEQMKILREKEMEIFRSFIDVCKKLNLQYFVVQGTLLGAVRHQGFIPWDDDIDVGMLREDFDIFIEKGQALLPEEFFVQTHFTDPAYPHGFAKIRNNQTAFVETSSKNLRMNHGIFIDVFPFDYYPDGLFSKITFETKKLLLRYRIRCSLFEPAAKEKTAGNFARWVMKEISKKIYPSLTEALDKQYALYKNIKKGRYRINNGSPWGKRECIPKEWVQTTTPVLFEGMKVAAPIKYKKYLEHVYGDYMKLPPLERRVTHHYLSYIDFEKAYSPGNINSCKGREL